MKALLLLCALLGMFAGWQQYRLINKLLDCATARQALITEHARQIEAYRAGDELAAAEARRRTERADEEAARYEIERDQALTERQAIEAEIARLRRIVPVAADCRIGPERVRILRAAAGADTDRDSAPGPPAASPDRPVPAPGTAGG